MATRKEIVFTNHDGVVGWWGSSELALTITRRGVEISGFYNTFGGMQSFALTWDQLALARQQVNAKTASPSR